MHKLQYEIIETSLLMVRFSNTILRMYRDGYSRSEIYAELEYYHEHSLWKYVFASLNNYVEHCNNVDDVIYTLEEVSAMFKHAENTLKRVKHPTLRDKCVRFINIKLNGGES